MKKEAINQYGHEDSWLSLGDYWDKHKLTMANNHGWKCEGTCGEKPGCLKRCKDKHARTQVLGTTHNYDRYIHRVDDFLSASISEISFLDLCDAIGKAQRARNLAETTAVGILSMVRQVFQFAEAHGDAVDITQYTKEAGKKGPEADIVAVLSNHSSDYIRQALQDERDRLASTTKSLTIWQLEKISVYLWEHIEEDGRYCLICLMLYAGVRPAEGRALRWKDIVPFLDHPECEIINVFNIRDADGNLNPMAKSDNAYRRIPVHVELAKYLKRRREFVEKHIEGPIDDLPICCFENEFKRPCRDYQAAALAQRVFKGLGVKDDFLYASQIEMLSERYDRNAAQWEEEEIHLTLYVLRRNFWTWLQANTRLSDGDKRLIMGHDLPDGQSRKEKNNENLLWEILREMNGCVISKKLYEQCLVVKIDGEGPTYIVDQGVCRIHLSEEMLAAGVNLCISATTEEAGESIRLKALTPVRSVGGITPRVHVVGVPPKSRNGINCQLENWQAHQKPVRPHSEKKKNQDE